MAERQGTTNSSAIVHSTDNIRTIVENVVNHPQFCSLLTDAVGSSRQTPEFEKEENNGAQWSRTNVNNATSNTASANPGRSTYASPVEEFRAIFRFGSSSRHQGGGPKTTVRVFLLDFSKAFDLIDHNILLYKLYEMKVPSKIINWI